MCVGIQKYRATRWVGRLLIVLSLVASCGAQAAENCTPPSTITWCSNDQIITSPNDYPHCVYPTPLAAAQAYADARTASPYGTGPSQLKSVYKVTSCDSKGLCFLTILVYWEPDSPTVFLDALLVPFVCSSSLTITLSGGTEVEPSNGPDKKFLPIIATVLDQSTNKPPTNPVKVHVSLKVEDLKSGGHDHGDSTRPRGGIAEVATCASDGECWTSKESTDSNGQVVFNFNAPEASGTHTISATCDGCGNTATKPVNVMVDGLQPLLGSAYYALTEDGSTKVIGDNGKHSGNHYLTSSASMKIWRVARDFYEYQIHKSVAKPTLLHLNDASLKWGGKFDVSGKWTGYHYSHDRGTAIDVRANTAAGYIPEAYFTDFENMADGIGADAQLHCSATRDPSIDNCVGDENRHYHVILN